MNETANVPETSGHMYHTESHLTRKNSSW